VYKGAGDGGGGWRRKRPRVSVYAHEVLAKEEEES